MHELPHRFSTSAMPPKLKTFLQRWIVTTVAVLVAAHMVEAIRYDHWHGLLVATLLLGVLNAFLRPLILFATVGILGAFNFLLGLRLALLTLPLQILSFGFLLLAINAILLLLVTQLVPSFHADGFWTAFKGGLIISVISLLLNSLTGTGNARVQWQRGKPTPPGNRRDPGNDDGPVIDL
jgi:putative membrane protein